MKPLTGQVLTELCSALGSMIVDLWVCYEQSLDDLNKDLALFKSSIVRSNEEQYGLAFYIEGEPTVRLFNDLLKFYKNRAPHKSDLEDLYTDLNDILLTHDYQELVVRNASLCQAVPIEG